MVVPKAKTETNLELAHSHLMTGHLGAQNTIELIPGGQGTEVLPGIPDLPANVTQKTFLSSTHSTANH